MRKYEEIMLEIEALAKDKEANAEKLQELSQELAENKAYFSSVSSKLVNKKLKTKKLSYREYCNLKDTLDQKSIYFKNSEKIDAVINGDYSVVKQKRKVVFRRFVKTAGVITLAGLLAFVGVSCHKKHKKQKDSKKDVVIDEINDTTEETKEDSNKNTESDKKDSTTEATTEEEKQEDKEDSKENKDDKNDEKDDKDVDKNDTNTEDNTTTNVDNNGKPSNTTDVSQNTSSNTESNGYSNTSTTTNVTPVTPYVVPTEGELPIEPTTEVIDDTSDVPSTDNQDVEYPASTDTPSIDNVDGNDETTYDVPDNSSHEPEYNGTDEHRPDSYSEEDAPSNVPSIDNVDGNDEITYDIPDNSSNVEKEYDGDEENKPNNMFVVNEPTDEVPPLDEKHIDDDGSSTKVFTVQTETNEETDNNSMPSLDNIEDDGTEIIINDYTDENEITYNVDYDYTDTYVTEESDFELPSFDNVEDDEESFDVNLSGKTYTLTFPGMTL